MNDLRQDYTEQDYQRLLATVKARRDTYLWLMWIPGLFFLFAWYASEEVRLGQLNNELLCGLLRIDRIVTWHAAYAAAQVMAFLYSIYYFTS